MTTFDHIIKHFNSASILFYLIVLTILAIVFIVIIAILQRMEIRAEIAKRLMPELDEDDRKRAKRDIHIGKIIPVFLFISILSSIFIYISIYGLSDLYFVAKQHGYQDGLNVNAESLWRGVQNSPVESTLPDDETQLKQSIIIYYRFGCKDCEATFKDIQTQLTGYDIYWISSRSEQGIKLRETYPVSEVPSAVYINRQGTAYTYVLFKKTDNGPAVDDEEIQNLKALIEYDKHN